MDKIKSLLIIDVQKGVFKQKQPVHNPKALIENLAEAIDWARQSGILVIYVQHENNTFLKRDTADWDIVDAIAPKESDIRIYKKKPNAFEGTGLHEALQKEGITELIAGGLISNGCVQATCEGAVELGYRVVLMQDGHSTVYKNPEKVIKDVHRVLAEKGVQIVGVGELAGL